MRKFGSRPGIPAAGLAVFLLAQLALAGLLFSADGVAVRFGGRPVGSACFLRQRTGIPCPTCGMSRSVVATLHGDLGTALRANPAGPVWVAAVFSVALALLWLARRQRAGSGAGERAARPVRALAIAQGALLLAVLAGHWIRIVAALG